MIIIRFKIKFQPQVKLQTEMFIDYYHFGEWFCRHFHEVDIIDIEE